MVKAAGSCKPVRYAAVRALVVHATRGFQDLETHHSSPSVRARMLMLSRASERFTRQNP